MKDEVEEFLRRVAQMRAQAEAQGKGQQQPRPTPQKQPPKPVRQPPPARLVPRPESAAPPVNVEIVDAELADTADRFSQRLRDDMRGTEQVGEHARHFGEKVDAANAKMQSHLHQVFDHQLGQLKSSSIETALVTSERTSAELSLDHIRRMLGSPESVRDAIIMSEILRRPEFK